MCLVKDELDKLSPRSRASATSGGSSNSSRPGSGASNSSEGLSSSGTRSSSPIHHHLSSSGISNWEQNLSLAEPCGPPWPTLGHLGHLDCQGLSSGT